MRVSIPPHPHQHIIVFLLRVILVASRHFSHIISLNLHNITPGAGTTIPLYRSDDWGSKRSSHLPTRGHTTGKRQWRLMSGLPVAPPCALEPRLPSEAVLPPQPPLQDLSVLPVTHCWDIQEWKQLNTLSKPSFLTGEHPLLIGDGVYEARWPGKKPMHFSVPTPPCDRSIPMWMDFKIQLQLGYSSIYWSTWDSVQPLGDFRDTPTSDSSGKFL